MLVNLDQRLFLFLNSIHSPFWDQVMSAVSGILIWVPLYIVILYFIWVKYRKNFLVILLIIIAAVTLTDQMSVLLKNLVQRPRPCYEPLLQGLVHTVGGRCGGRYSFVSSHAANTFVVAMLSSLFLKNRWYSASIMSWAFIVSYSRIYLGVHYPGDMICGAFLGMLIGWSMYRVYILIENKYLKNKQDVLPE
jgi:undecaprenyl-diphosphatase